jgi:serine/threonine protein kinase
MIGEKILNYEVEKLIGEGGIGQVFLAKHAQLGRKVAIKVLNPNLVNNPEIRERFKQEATTLSNLQHLNIVTLYDYLENEKGLFLIMEYVEGYPLDEYIQNVSGPLNKERALNFFYQILDGFAYAHAKGIVHRDIKPSNIIISEDGQAKILDFGIAKILKSEKPAMTKAGTKVGTVLYMSPEQVTGENIDARSDVYSLGVTLWEMLTARNPYDENTETEFTIYNKILNEKLPQITDFYPAAPKELQDIINIATQKNPKDRFQSCEEFKRALLESTHTQIKPTNTYSTQQNKQENNTHTKENTSFGNTNTQNTSPNKSKSAEIRARRERSYTMLYLLFFFLIALTGYFIWQELNKNQKNTLKENNEITENNSNKDKENKDKNDKEEENKDEKKEEKKPEEIELDSLNKKLERIEETEKLLEKEQQKQSLKKLVVFDNLVSDEMGEFVLDITLSNKSLETTFKDIVVSITFTNHNAPK